MRSETTRNHQLHSVSLLHLLIATALIAIAFAFMQKINFSDQYYDNDRKNQLRNLIFGLPLALSVAVVGLVSMKGESRRIILAGKLACFATAAMIVMLALSPLLIKSGYSRPTLFAFTIVPLFAFALSSIFCLHRLWALSLFVALATLCFVEYASFQTLRPAGSLYWHDIAAWAYAAPIVLWLTIAASSVAVRTITPIRGVLALAPMTLLLVTLLSEWLYEFFWMRTR